MKKEIEKKWIVVDTTQSYIEPSDKLNLLNSKTIIDLYDLIMKEGDEIIQGYVYITFYTKTIMQSPFRLRKIIKKTGEVIYQINSKKNTEFINGFVSNDEIEYEISKSEFDMHWKFVQNKVHKKRLIKEIDNIVYEFDAFLDRFLILAECEVNDINTPNIIVWGKDVTEDILYSNKSLAK